MSNTEPKAELAIRDMRVDYPMLSAESLAAMNAAVDTLHRSMTPGTDYDTIPGTRKPTLLKPGAEKVLRVFCLGPRYEIVKQTEDWDRGLFDYVVRCTLVHHKTQIAVADGLGSSSTFESKYRYRYTTPKCPKCGKETIRRGKEEFGGGYYCAAKQGGCGTNFKSGPDLKAIEAQPVGRVENPDRADQKNTVLKMAEKRALTAAALNFACLSDRFTQDMEDRAPEPEAPEAKPVPRPGPLPEHREGCEVVKYPAPERVDPATGEVLDDDSPPEPVDVPWGEPPAKPAAPPASAADGRPSASEAAQAFPAAEPPAWAAPLDEEGKKLAVKLLDELALAAAATGKAPTVLLTEASSFVPKGKTEAERVPGVTNPTVIFFKGGKPREGYKYAQKVIHTLRAMHEGKE